MQAAPNNPLKTEHIKITPRKHSLPRCPHYHSVSRSMKKGQGATPKMGNSNVKQPMSKGQPLDAATQVKKQKNMCQGQIKMFIIN